MSTTYFLFAGVAKELSAAPDVDGRAVDLDGGVPGGVVESAVQRLLSFFAQLGPNTHKVEVLFDRGDWTSPPTSLSSPSSP